MGLLHGHGELEHLARAREEEQRLGLRERQSVADDGSQLGDCQLLRHQILHFVYSGQSLLLQTNYMNKHPQNNSIYAVFALRSKSKVSKLLMTFFLERINYIYVPPAPNKIFLLCILHHLIIIIAITNLLISLNYHGNFLRELQPDILHGCDPLTETVSLFERLIVIREIESQQWDVISALVSG